MAAITRFGSFLVIGGLLLAGGVASAQSDTCATATDVSGGGLYTGTTVGATNDGQNTCGSSSTNPDVWYRFTTGCAGTLELNTCGSVIDSVISIHSACPGAAGNTLDCNDDTSVCGGIPTLQSSLSTFLPAGSNVLIRVSTFGVTPAGAYNLDVVFLPDTTVLGSLRNGGFSGGGSWCFFDQSSNGAVDYSTGAAVVTGGSDGIAGSSTYIEQTFTTFDNGSHRIAFDWSYSSTNSPTWDSAWWDLIDVSTSLSVVAGPITLSDATGGAGSVSQVFSGSGIYTLRLGSSTVDGLFGPAVSTYDNVVVTCDDPVDRFSNGDFSLGSSSWCFLDESDSGSVDFSSGAAVVRGGNDGLFDRLSSIRQTFTTFDTAVHTLTFDWSYSSTNAPGFDEARWDLIDEGTGLSAVGGPWTLSDTSGASGTVSELFSGSGTYTLILGTLTDDSCCGAGLSTFDDIAIGCAAPSGPFTNGSFSSGADGWCFFDESVSGTVDFSTGAAVVTGGNDLSADRFTFIQQTFETHDTASHIISFAWSYGSTNVPPFDAARWDLIDEGTGLSVVGGPLTLSDVSGSSGTASQSFTGTGIYTLRLGTWTDDGCCGAGVTTFDDVAIVCDLPVDRFSNGDFAAGSDSWCFTDESVSGSVDFSTGAAVITGGNDLLPARTTSIRQRFTTSDAASHTISFDWSYSTTNAPGFDEARWDLVDNGTGLSVVGGPLTLASASGFAGAVLQGFSGTGDYTLVLATWTDDGCCGAGVTTFDNVSIACDDTAGPFANGSFSDPTGAPWCFSDESGTGSVDFSTGAAIVTGGDDTLSPVYLYTNIAQSFVVPAVPHDISFTWAYGTTNAPGWDGAYWDLIDQGTGLSVVAGPLTLSQVDGTGGLASASFTGSGAYTLFLGTFTEDNQFGAGVSLFDDVSIVPQACDPVTGLVCAAAGPTVDLSWTNGDAYAEVRIYREGALVATLPGSATSHADAGVAPGTYDYEVVGDCGVVDAAPVGCTVTVVPPPPSFRRGDSNNDGAINIADAVYLLANLFPAGGPPSVLFCLDASDANDDDVINIADPISILAALFGSPTTPLPSPYPTCGVDPTPGALGCTTTICP